jgi:hypothetical protein
MELGPMDLQLGMLTTRPQRWSTLETAARESVVATSLMFICCSMELAMKTMNQRQDFACIRKRLAVKQGRVCYRQNAIFNSTKRYGGKAMIQQNRFNGPMGMGKVPWKTQK